MNLPSNELLLIHNQYWIRHFSDILKHFLVTNSGVLRRFEDFLFNELHDPSDGALSHTLWRSFYQEHGAPESTQRIRKSLEILRDIQSHLDYLNSKVKVGEVLSHGDTLLHLRLN